MAYYQIKEAEVALPCLTLGTLGSLAQQSLDYMSQTSDHYVWSSYSPFLHIGNQKDL